MNKQWLTKMAGTNYPGVGELWLDPKGNVTNQSDCRITIEENEILYSWSYENKIQNGRFTFNALGAIWVDSWHQSESVQCLNVSEAWGLFTLFHSYEVPNNPNWAWRSKLSERPDASLVLQMTNITPWAEEGRAVRMVFSA